MIGLGQTYERKDVIFYESDQGQAGGQHLPVWSRGAQVFRDIDQKPLQGGQP